MKTFLIIWLLLTFAVPCWLLLTNRINLKADYRTANRDSAYLAPDPRTMREAAIQAYSARAFNWRGIFASHCWLAVKPKDAPQYTVYQVVGWLVYQGLPSLAIMQDIPDRNWYGARPHLILDMQGAKAEALIPKITQAVDSYPYSRPYTLWPGPNSNTFPACIGRQVPELRLAMPANAVGKDFLPGGAFFAPAPSGTGYQFSLYGAFGLLIALKEGIEINLLGLVYGIKLWPPRILLPGME